MMLSGRYQLEPDDAHDLATPARRRILLAEDDALMRRMVALSLRRDGFDVIEVNDGAALITQLEQVWTSPAGRLPYHLVITDVQMPQVSGLDVIARLRRIDADTPVLVITAFGDDALHEEADRLDAGVLDKPFDLIDLRTAALYYARR